MPTWPMKFEAVTCSKSHKLHANMNKKQLVLVFLLLKKILTAFEVAATQEQEILGASSEPKTRGPWSVWKSCA